MDDEKYMRITLSLASKGRGTTSPNPMVGAIIVKDNIIIGKGYHRKAGTPHAEILALRDAGNNAEGGTLYVNLEPCCHIRKLTPPCTKEIIASRIKRVAIGMIDPNPEVSGQGIKELKKAGIEVDYNILQNDAERLNEVFTKYITTERPFVIMKIASSLDGKAALADGTSQWITGEYARGYVHRLRNDVDAVMVGIGTVNKDDPLLTTRLGKRKGKDPVKVIVDSRLSIQPTAKVLNQGSEIRVYIATTKRADRDKIKQIEKRGCEILIIDSEDEKEKVDLSELMRILGEKKITSLLIEGGSEINASALKNGIVDKVIFMIAPIIIGGHNSKGSVGGISPERLSDSAKIRDIKIKRLGEDIIAEGYIS
ncbi:MAG: bifunctional diaminohydroxyphosphoribosylaminopyrimidine deaminase/5-amino-6-(5-phosphoribosylamino)uracil reductase RibD [Nitrospirota bacterium]